MSGYPKRRIVRPGSPRNVVAVAVAIAVDFAGGFVTTTVTPYQGLQSKGGLSFVLKHLLSTSKSHRSDPRCPGIVAAVVVAIGGRRSDFGGHLNVVVWHVRLQ